ncbi:MAG: TetR/AcrR family transcriptional regulator [Oceanospirillaceae bacterium]|nr:TetR/AcrR family transcriptional regulator [Oceanospirillaceae bacterium]
MPRGRPSKKQLILDTAQDLFAEHGYQGTAIDLVVRKAQVSKPTVYNNFPSKQALLQSLISRQLVLIEERQMQIINSRASACDKLYTLFEQIINHPFERTLYKIYYGESYKLNPDTLQLLAQIESLSLQNCQQILNHVTDSDTQISAIIAIYTQALLMGSLAGINSASRAELSSKIQVLSLINGTKK